MDVIVNDVVSLSDFNMAGVPVDIKALRRIDMEYVFLGHNNYSSLILTTDGNAIGTAEFTSMELQIGATLVSSTNLVTDPIQWNKAGYALGEVRCFLGFIALEPGHFNSPLLVYSPTYPNGVVWDWIRFRVIGEVEALPYPVAPGDGLSISEYVSVGIH